MHVPMHDVRTNEGTFGVRIGPKNPDHRVHEIDVSEEIIDAAQNVMIDEIKKLTQSQSQAS